MRITGEGRERIAPLGDVAPHLVGAGLGRLGEEGSKSLSAALDAILGGRRGTRGRPDPSPPRKAPGAR